MQQPKYTIGTVVPVEVDAVFNNRSYPVRTNAAIVGVWLLLTDGGKPKYEYSLSLGGIDYSNYVKSDLRMPETELIIMVERFQSLCMECGQELTGPEIETCYQCGGTS